MISKATLPLHLLDAALPSFSIPAIPNTHTDFTRFYDLLVTWNRRHNLTRIDDPVEFVEKHLLDSLLVLPFLPKHARILDLGTGAGFPGIPLAIYQKHAEGRSSHAIVLIESLKKKVAFLHMAKATIGLKDVTIADVTGTPDTLLELSHAEPSTSATPCVVTRATHSLFDLLALCHPILTEKNGLLIAMKGPHTDDEVDLAPFKTRLLELNLTQIVHGPFVLPKTRAERFLHVICRADSTEGCT